MGDKFRIATTRESLEAIRKEGNMDSLTEAREAIEEAAGMPLPVVTMEEVLADTDRSVIIVGTTTHHGQRFRSTCNICRGSVWHAVRRPDHSRILCSVCFRRLREVGFFPGLAPEGS
jgi:hypothetical protein